MELRVRKVRVAVELVRPHSTALLLAAAGMLALARTRQAVRSVERVRLVAVRMRTMRGRPLIVIVLRTAIHLLP